jgi:hypothetical protein
LSTQEFAVISRICLDWGRWERRESDKGEMIFNRRTHEEGNNVAAPFPVDTGPGAESGYREGPGLKNLPTS